MQADVTSTQRFSLCSETASATTSFSDKSVNASIALDDGAASTRALAGSVLNMKLDAEACQAAIPTQPDSSSGQAASLSSLDEMGNLAKRARRNNKQQQQQSSDSASAGEDAGSERVRFDHHVSFIEADEEARPSRRKRKDEAQLPADVDGSRSLRILRRLFAR